MTSNAQPGAWRFADRHIGTSLDRERMLERLGLSSLDEAVAGAIPAGIHDPHLLGLASTDEATALAELRDRASRNRVVTSMIGLGYFGTVTPSVIQRNVLENPSWYTAYTPYQPEISQGRLEALITFQTMITDLTGMATANASMLDEGTAAVEGMLLARRASRSKVATFLVDADALPQTKALLANRAEPLGIELVEVTPERIESGVAPEAFGVLLQYPGASGRVRDLGPTIAAAKGRGLFTVVAADPLALVLLASPGSLGADIAVGSTQRFGVQPGFGGPHAGYLAVRAGLERQMPGRLVGVSVDADAEPAYRLTLQTREQHIRRERATSNICTAQVLLAVMAAMYAVYHGPVGLRAIALDVAGKARRLADALGDAVVHDRFFDTVRVRVDDADASLARALEAGINIWRVDEHTVSVSVDETTSDADLSAVARALGGGEPGPGMPGVTALGADVLRTDPILTHPVFNSYHSETAMMRYLKRLADADYALDRGMIPLGSCTMKLNAATEMEALTWPEFAAIHPFAPADQVAGYLELIEELSGWLCDITGYDAVSLQPNAGSQGELSGLLAIRGYHRSRGETQRDVCLIPSSAHGTNAASAVLAGMRVVVVACDEDGNVDLDDLRARIEEAGDRLAALMITYPSTHGVYEQDIVDLCDAVHAGGGQVYIDGANLNALIGFARFGKLGGDVSHLNLHKTFAIPHGGGGPGVGPVAARAHLAPFLPGHPMAQAELGGAGASRRPVSAAPYGSPSVLPISWAYVRLMGGSGLREASASAVLAANYVAAELADEYPILYNRHGRVAHECILDLRPLKAETGVTVDDVAKRLVDYGFHAPTMSFPVAGTLMVEPTESEDLAELDRFVAAMRRIKAEALRVAAGEWPADDNPLVNAPHTAASIAGEWEHPYTRQEAVYPFATAADAANDPAGTIARVRGKYWPPVRRIDQAYGDRHLVCSCPPPEAFA